MLGVSVFFGSIVHKLMLADDQLYSQSACVLWDWLHPAEIAIMWACRLTSNGGSLLVPPLGGPARMAELGPLLPQDILLEGSSWKESSVDIAIAGMTAKTQHSVTYNRLC